MLVSKAAIAKTGVKAVKNKVKNAILGGKLEKAFFVEYQTLGDTIRVKNRFEVQFNPSEYSISRGVRHSEKRPLGRDTSARDVQTVHAEESVLSLTIYFDSYTELNAHEGLVSKLYGKVEHLLKGQYNDKLAAHSFLPSFDMNEDLSPDYKLHVNERLEKILWFIKFNQEEHAPPPIGFVWGSTLFFVGKLQHHNIHYTLFDKHGSPVRAKLTMSIVGEDMRYDSDEYPFESPDRTKQRTLRYGDQLWMTAQEEYGDAARWKTIAQANGILNPRAIDNAVKLKVPSIR